MGVGFGVLMLAWLIIARCKPRQVLHPAMEENGGMRWKLGFHGFTGLGFRGLGLRIQHTQEPYPLASCRGIREDHAEYFLESSIYQEP